MSNSEKAHKIWSLKMNRSKVSREATICWPDLSIVLAQGAPRLSIPKTQACILISPWLVYWWHYFVSMNVSTIGAVHEVWVLVGAVWVFFQTLGWHHVGNYHSLIFCGKNKSKFSQISSVSQVAWALTFNLITKSWVFAIILASMHAASYKVLIRPNRDLPKIFFCKM